MGRTRARSDRWDICAPQTCRRPRRAPGPGHHQGVAAPSETVHPHPASATSHRGGTGLVDRVKPRRSSSRASTPTVRRYCAPRLGRRLPHTQSATHTPALHRGRTGDTAVDCCRSAPARAPPDRGDSPSGRVHIYTCQESACNADYRRFLEGIRPGVSRCSLFVSRCSLFDRQGLVDHIGDQIASSAQVESAPENARTVLGLDR